MCDLNSLAKIFLWGGYCYKHFHKATTTARPTTTLPTTTVPTTTPTTSACNCEIASEVLIENVCEQREINFPGAVFTSEPCGQTFSVLVENLLSCEMQGPTNIRVTVTYTGEGAMFGSVSVSQVGEGCLRPVPQFFCASLGNPQMLTFSSIDPCYLQSLQLNAVIDCVGSCSIP